MWFRIRQYLSGVDLNPYQNVTDPQHCYELKRIIMLYVI
jgi:hypothetical protein